MAEAQKVKPQAQVDAERMIECMTREEIEIFAEAMRIQDQSPSPGERDPGAG